MRIKKDPSVRQEAFINAATALFIEKGYEAVSVRDVLDAVADKSASPSVFYYYFPSKDALYHACIEAIADRYVAGFRRQFSMKFETTEEWLLSQIGYLRDYLVNYLASERNIIMTGRSELNHMFILDMREKVTKQVAELWADSLSLLPAGLISDTRKLSQFLSGGVSEMIYNYMLEENKDRDSAEALIRDIIRFSVNTIGFDDEEKRRLISVIEAYYGRSL